MKIGEDLTATCHATYTLSLTQLAADVTRFPNPDDGFPDSEGARKLAEGVEACPVGLNYYLRPETVESYYVLYWITGDRKYQEWGWEAFEAIERYCRTPLGYSGIEDVTSANPKHDDLQQSFFMAETLKYLYLLFSPQNHFSLDDWVFNSEAHPFKVQK